MANVDSPFGLKPVRHMMGVPLAATIRPYYISASYGTALFIGDPVLRYSDGSNATAVSAPAAGSFPIGTLPEVRKAAATTNTPITGVIVGFAANPSNLDQKHNPANTERIAYVCDDPFMVYEIQADGAVAATSVGLNANLIFTHAGSAVTGLSGVELDTTSDVPATTATDQLKIIRLVNREDNDTGASHVKVEVMINRPSQFPGVDGI
jgi:hypothetical protein